MAQPWRHDDHYRTDCKCRFLWIGSQSEPVAVAKETTQQKAERERFCLAAFKAMQRAKLTK